ncbi:peroxisomal membrane protein PEX16 [Ischnura elegans]|uniref:peroxisomal membrane protein PEX16 n=1 Tax=Ischnura elegans TaxID=197161 RepID=UPI001ED89169|nr:peroxisomal membrane protein PEX16 [Ischnura elegans]
MSSAVNSLAEFYCAYKEWVSQNPQKSADLETTAKWVSYFIAGRINNSSIVSELVYSLSNLLVLFNDRIIFNARRIGDRVPGEKLKIFLTVLEYTEVFIEITAKKTWGNRGKWILIVIVQLVKCISKLLLFFHYKERITTAPSVPPLQRTEFLQRQVSELSRTISSTSAFSLKSGRVIRTVSSAPPLNARSWSPPLLPPNNNVEQFRLGGSNIPMPMSVQIAEIMYLLKPLLYLGAVYTYEEKPWRPWLLSLGLDLMSLKLNHMGRSPNMSREERKELSRRSIALVLYLLRSPYYERVSAKPLHAALNAMSNNLPLVGHVFRPLAHYLPEWQRTYFYMWST